MGIYKTVTEAFSAYAIAKKREIIRAANEYKDIIPSVTYDYIVNYEIKIENDKNYNPKEG